MGFELLRVALKCVWQVQEILNPSLVMESHSRICARSLVNISSDF